MAPIRRYLRITKYSVLEVRIYLDDPALAETWLLRPRDPALPRVIEAVRPLVLPKLREENEKSKRKGGKKNKGTKDTVSQDEFEVSIFLTETSTTHTLLTKQKAFADKARVKSNSGKLGIGNYLQSTTENPISVDDDQPPNILLEEDADETRLDDIPEATTSSKKRGRSDGEAIDVSDDDDDDDDSFQTQNVRSKKKQKSRDVEEEEPEQEDDKKKMALNTQYEGFSIYGRILCLIVKRKGVKKSATAGPSAGSEMLENWVSTQANNDSLGIMDDVG